MQGLHEHFFRENIQVRKVPLLTEGQPLGEQQVGIGR